MADPCRFATVDEQDISNLLKEKDSGSTKRCMKGSVRLFRAYLANSGSSADFENFTNSELNDKLRGFYASVRNSDGGSYKKSSMNSLKYGLAKYLKQEKGIDVNDHADFRSSREVFLAVLSDLKKRGFGGIDHHPAIQPEDLYKLYTNGLALNITTPVGLQNKVWFEVMVYLCRRGRENLRSMNKNTFGVSTDSTGLKFVYQKVDESDKNHNHAASTDDTVGEGRIYEIPGSPLCPVLSFELYMSKLHHENDALWQRPKDSFCDTDEEWYSKAAIGKNTLAKFMSNISKLAELSAIFTNHSIRTTCVTLLDDAGIEARHIMRTSGHRSETSIRSYAHRLSDNKKREISATLSSAIGAPVTPSSCASVPTPIAKPGSVVAENVLLPGSSATSGEMPTPNAHENGVCGPSSISNETIMVPDLQEVTFPDICTENVTPLSSNDLLSDSELLRIIESLQDTQAVSRPPLLENSINTSNVVDFNIGSNDRNFMNFTPNISNCQITMNFYSGS